MVTGVDKYEFKLKVDEMKALVGARNYHAAAEIAETINWKKIRNLNALVLAGEVFEQVGRYEDSKEILLLAYDKSPIGRNIIYRLAEIAIKTNRFDDAQEYYDEFVDIAPHDNLKYVLKYKMTAAQGLPYKEQIKILEELKEQEYSEEWAYELAFLYHMDMQPEKCVEACDELILWFGDGIYVEKALELKMHYQPLSKPQEEKYHIFRQKRTGVIEVKPNDSFESGEIIHEAVEIPSVRTNPGQYNTANLQKEIAKGMQQIHTVKMQQDANMRKQVRQDASMGGPFRQNLSFLQQPQQIRYQEPEQYQGRYQEPEPEQYQGRYQEPEQYQGRYQEPEPEQYQESEQQTRAMTMEEIQAEWERTKQEMNDALNEAAGPQQQEASKERSIERAEQLMQRLLGIIPQLAGQIAQQQLPETDVREEEPSKVRDDLEQAGRIVAGINQLLQNQIDSLQAGQIRMQQEEPILPEVSDPTRELPRVSEMMLEGKEIGAIDKVQMNGNSLNKNMAKKDENPVMSAWKEAQPGISAIDLLQRVRMEKTTAAEVSKPDPETADLMRQKQQMDAAGTQRQQQQADAETADMGIIRQMQTGNSALESLRQMQAGHSALESLRQLQAANSLAAQNGQSQEDRQFQAENVRSKNSTVDSMTHTYQQIEQQVSNAAQDELQTQATLKMPADRLQPMQDISSEMPVQMQQPMPEQSVQMRQLVPEVPVQMRQLVPEAPVEMQQSMSEVPVQMQQSVPEMSAQMQQSVPEVPVQMRQLVLEASVEMQQPMPEMPVQIQQSMPEIPVQVQQSMPEMSVEMQRPMPEMPAQMQQSTPDRSSELYMQQDSVLNAQDIPYENTINAASAQTQVAESMLDSADDNINTNMKNSEAYEFEETINEKPEYPQDNIFLASKPRFLTQAQLQAGAAMDGKKTTQVTKEFSKEAMVAAHTENMNNISKADSQELKELKRLTPEQKQIFSYFVPIAGMEAQIYDLLMGVSEHLQYDKHAQSGNIIIEGISGSGKTVLIMDIIKVLQKEIKRPVGKTGKIDANTLNQKDPDVLMDKISGGCLIIESAGKISRETAVRLSKCMEKDHAGTLYIIEDTEEGIQKALERDSSFAAKFTEKITIPLFSSDELVEFGKAYANDLNYDIDEMGVLALYKRISAIQKLDHVTTLTEVKEIVDEAIDNAEKGVLKKVFGMLTATRANDDNYIILREKDFEES